MKNGFESLMKEIELPDEMIMKDTIERCRDVKLKKHSRSNRWQLMIEQLYFLKSKNWLMNILLLVLGYCAVSLCIKHNLLQQIRFLLGFVPVLLHLFMIPVLLKSVDYNTVDLENVTYHCYADLVLCRIVWIGLSLLFQITIFMFLSYGNTALSLEQIALYTLVPFNFVCILSFMIMSYVHNTQCIYYCILSNIFFSILLFLLSNTQIYMRSAFLFLWRMMFLLSLFAVIIGFFYFIQQLKHKKQTTWERRMTIWN